MKIGIGSVKPFRTPSTLWLDRDKITRVFEYQSRWFPGLVPSNQGRFLTNDVTAFTGSSMSLLDALPESICLVSLSSRQFGPVPRLPEACRPVLVGLAFLRPARSCARSPGWCRPVLVGLPVPRSARSCAQIDGRASFDSTHVEFQACFVMFQYGHQYVAPPQ